MKIKLKNKKNLFKNLKLNKKKGENILFVGSIGSGIKDCIMSTFQIMTRNQLINDTSIFIDTVSDIRSFISWYSIRKKHSCKENINTELFSLLDQNGFDKFSNTDFKNEYKNSYKSTIFLLPAIVKCERKLQKDINAKLFNFLKNLPVNNDKEIPIIINNIGNLKVTDLKRYGRLVIELNKKGYFILAGIEDYDYNNPEATLKYIKNNFKHIFLFKTELSKNEATYFFDDMFTGSQIRNLNCGEYFYLKNFKKENNKPLYFPYREIKIIKDINIQT